MKKAFCEPQNIDFCPPIQFAQAFVFGSPANDKLTIPRSSDNGGEIVYSSVDNVKTDFASGALHPSDLKPPLIKIAVGVLDKIATALNSSGDAKKAAATLKNFQKKLSKQKK